MKIIDLFSGIGNAVTVDIVELIAKRLKFIENEKSTCNCIRRA